jgi:imidazolonepropionase-like amidohydrolase
MTNRLVALTLACCGALACGQQPADNAALGPVPAEGLVITNARILDGSGGVIAQGSVVARDGRIVSVSAGTVDVPGALVIDAQGKTVMPGLIEAHRHVIGGDGDEWLTNEADARMREFLEAGFTTVLSAGDAEDAILELRRRLDAGELGGPRLLAAARVPLAQAAAGGGGRGGGDPARSDASRGARQTAGTIPPEDTIARVHAIAERGFDAVKTVIVVTPNGPEQATLARVVAEATRLGIPTITHAVSVEDTIAAVEAGTNVLVHTPHIGQLTEEQARMIAGSGIPMMSTLGVFVPFFDDNNRPVFRDALPYPWANLSSAGQGPVNARLLWEAGITYGYGTDTRFLPRDTLAHELTSLSLVFSPRDMVSILTHHAAVTIGKLDDRGTLEPGKLADLILVDGDPQADIFDVLNVEIVIRGGEIVIDNR